MASFLPSRASLVEERRVLKTRLDAELARCKAAEPHPYAVCQARYEKLVERIEEIDRDLARLDDAASAVTRLE